MHSGYIINRGGDMNINMTVFHNQTRFMQDVRQGEKIISQSDKELALKSIENCEFELGDMITSTGTGTVVRGQFGIVVDKELIGKYWRVKVRWGVDQRKKSYETSERVQDITMFNKGYLQNQKELKK